MRVLVTGSRIWRDAAMIRRKLDDCYETARSIRQDLVVVHGACKEGADAVADKWARAHNKGVIVEAYPARWSSPCEDTCMPGHRRPNQQGFDICPKAGFTRNEKMVNLGAELCLAFIADESKGSTHCADYAEKAGIPTLRFRDAIHIPVLF